MNYKYVIGVVALIIIGGSFMLLRNNESFVGSTPAGIAGTIATTSNRTWTVASELAFATSSCASRIVGTRGDAIRIVFSDWNAERPSASLGFPQAASTTVEYDASKFGCGAMYIFSYTAQVINLAETR